MNSRQRAETPIPRESLEIRRSRQLEADLRLFLARIRAKSLAFVYAQRARSRSATSDLFARADGQGIRCPLTCAPLELVAARRSAEAAGRQPSLRAKAADSETQGFKSLVARESRSIQPLLCNGFDRGYPRG